jgi:hypothetical protein
VSDPRQRLAELGLELPRPRRPRRPTSRGPGPSTWCSPPGSSRWSTGPAGHRQARCGARPPSEGAAELARAAAVNVLAVARRRSGTSTGPGREAHGVRGVQHPEFHEQHLVANGASELLGEVLGDAGVHARSAVGVAALPLGSTGRGGGGPGAGDGVSEQPRARGNRGGVVPVEDAVTVIVVRDASGPAGEGGALEVLLLERHHDERLRARRPGVPGRQDRPERRGCSAPPGSCAARSPGVAQRLGVEGPAAPSPCWSRGSARPSRSPASCSLSARTASRWPRASGARGGTGSTRAAHGGARDRGLRLACLARTARARPRPRCGLHVVLVGHPGRPPAALRHPVPARPYPAGQRPSHDDVETTSMRWIGPVDALAEHAAGHLHLIYPTRCTLEQLSTHPDSADAACGRHGTGRVDLRRIEPAMSCGSTASPDGPAPRWRPTRPR